MHTDYNRSLYRASKVYHLLAGYKLRWLIAADVEPALPPPPPHSLALRTSTESYPSL